jgi:hypothetical protein
MDASNAAMEQVAASEPALPRTLAAKTTTATAVR